MPTASVRLVEANACALLTRPAPIDCETPTSAPIRVVSANELANQTKKLAAPAAATAALPSLPSHAISIIV